MSTGAIDEARLEEFMGRMVGHMTGATDPQRSCRAPRSTRGDPGSLRRFGRLPQASACGRA
jgi:hypothetical protein